LTYSLAIGLVSLEGATTAKAQIVVPAPQMLSFVYQIGGPNPAPQTIYLSSNVPTQFSVSTFGAPWLTITPITGITPSMLIVTATPPADDRGGPPPDRGTAGTLSGSINIAAPASTDAQRAVIPVTLQILPPPQGNLSVSPTNIAFEYQTGAPAPAGSPISVTISGGVAAAFNVAVSTTSGGNWLTAASSVLTTPATIVAYVLPVPGMGPGTYNGTISVIPAYAGGVVQTVSVSLRVSSGGSLTANPNYLSFNYQPGSPFPLPQLVGVVDSSGRSSPFNVTSTTSSGGSWLTYSPSSGTTPGTFLVTANPSGLPPGTYYGTITVTPVGGSLPAQIPVSLTIVNSAQLLASPTSLTINYQAGGPSAPTQFIAVSSTGTPISFTSSVFGPSWITLTSFSNVTPAGNGVLVNPPATTPPGTYSATVTMAPTGTGGNQLSVPVTVIVTAANYLNVGRSSISFNYSIGGQIPEELVPVTSSSGPIRFQTVASTSWLSVTQAAQYTPGNITVGIVPAGLTAGTYQGTVSVFSDVANNSPQTIQVTLNVSSDPSLSASPFGLMFSYQIGLSVPPLQAVVVSNLGASRDFTMSAATATGGNWLLIAGGGSTPATVGVAVDPTSLTEGIYTGNITIIPTTAPVVPFQVPVILTVSATPLLRADANLVAFQYQTNGVTPAPQNLSVSATSGALGFYPTVQTSDGGSWLSVTPTYATTPTTATVSVNPTGLTAGSYLGLIAFNVADGSTPAYFVAVSLQISDGPILTVPSQFLTFSATTGGSITAAPTISVSSTGPPSMVQVTTPGTNWLQVNPTSAMTNVSLSVQASPASLSPGYYTGVVGIQIPGIQNSQQNVPVVFMVNPPTVNPGP
jgi:hypothetical protein